MHKHTLVLWFCFDSHGGVWSSLETLWSWESCLPIRWQLCVTIALVCNLLFSLSNGNILRYKTQYCRDWD